VLKFVALWNIAPGRSVEDFESWYTQVHMPDAKRIPGLRRYTTNRVARAEASGSRYYRMAELSFDSYEAAQAALHSPEWRHAFDDARGWIVDHLRLWLESEEVPLNASGTPE
jgi:uncharacterized protein (TIGR02118 family)